MPRRNLAGTFEGAPNYRWKKMVNGTTWRLLCRARKDGESKENTGWLGLPDSDWTKERSLPAANAWWEAKLAELRPVDPLRMQAIANRERLVVIAQSSGQAEMAADLAQQIVEIKKGAEVVTGGKLGLNVNPLRHSTEANRLAFETLGKNHSAIQSSKKVRTNLDEFLSIERRRLKPQSYRELADYLEKVVVSVVPAESSIDSISEKTVTAHYLWLAEQPWEAAGKNKRVGFFRRFLNWLYSEHRIEHSPRNLRSRQHRFKSVTKAIKRFDKVKDVLDKLPAAFQLWGWLGINCGMTQVDMGSLDWSMIDTKKWTLTRKRVKTESEKTVPTVTYKLFPETVKLLKAKGIKASGLVFTTGDENPLYRAKYGDSGDKVRKTDLFSTYWNRIDPKPAIPLGKYRSIGATILKSSIEFRWAETIFLGQSPKTVADKHYGAESDSPFFEALAFIRSNLDK